MHCKHHFVPQNSSNNSETGSYILKTRKLVYLVVVAAVDSWRLEEVVLRLDEEAAHALHDGCADKDARTTPVKLCLVAHLTGQHGTLEEEVIPEQNNTTCY